MGDVIDACFAERELWGKAKCLVCDHHWDARAPEGVTQLECSECKCMKGVFIHPAMPDPHFACTVCSNDLFYVEPDYTMTCARCGQRGDMEGPYDDEPTG